MSSDDASQQFDRVDPIDHKLIDALRRNARATNRALAEFLQLSPSASLARLRKLERRRIIVGYTVLLGGRVDGGEQPYLVEVELGSHHPAALRQFEALLRADADVVSAVRVAGKYDYLVRMASTPAATWDRLAEAAGAIGVPIRQARITTIVEAIKGQANP